MSEELNETSNNGDAVPAVEEPVIVEQEAPKNECDYSAIKAVIDAHFSTIEGLVRYSKAKDANVLTLSKQLQEYREGFTKTLYKRIAIDLINYREECRKSYRDAEETISKDTSIKYQWFLCDDFRDLMQGIGITEESEEFFYNGKPLDGEISPVELASIDELPETSLPTDPVTNYEELIAYLQNTENVIVSILKNNSALDALVADYIKVSAVYEAGLYQVVLYPTIRKIVALYKSIAQKAESNKDLINDENAAELYKNLLEQLISTIEEILFLLDVSINRDLQDCYDAKTNRIIKTLLTEDAELNGKIAFQYTDCYVMDEKIIYPAKVDVYKLK